MDWISAVARPGEVKRQYHKERGQGHRQKIFQGEGATVKKTKN